jgi:hypothetical protein
LLVNTSKSKLSFICSSEWQHCCIV